MYKNITHQHSSCIVIIFSIIIKENNLITFSN